MAGKEATLPICFTAGKNPAADVRVLNSNSSNINFSKAELTKKRPSTYDFFYNRKLFDIRRTNPHAWNEAHFQSKLNW
jgi:hypothetical protein